MNVKDVIRLKVAADFYHQNLGQIHQRGMNRLVLHILIFIFFILQIFDIYSSYILFGDLDPVVFYSVEFNPVVAVLMAKLGVISGLLIIKIMAISLLSWVLIKMGPTVKFLSILGLINILYSIGLYCINYKLLVEFNLL